MKKIFIIIILLLSTTVYAQTYTVERVIDGNSLKLSNGEMVELIGVDAQDVVGIPKHRYSDDRVWESSGEKTLNFVKGLIEPGDEIRLEFDVQKRDKYGRLLAYVYVSESAHKILKDGSDVALAPIELFLNEMIIKAGYASPMTIPPNVKYADLFKALYKEARENKRGLWKQELTEKHYVCTAEAKPCPDGSAVGRSGPNCEFEPCPE